MKTAQEIRAGNVIMQGKDPNAGVLNEDSSGHDELKSFEKNLKDRVNKAAHQCETAANFIADGDSNLCWVYHDLSQKIEPTLDAGLQDSTNGCKSLTRSNDSTQSWGLYSFPTALPPGSTRAVPWMNCQKLQQLRPPCPNVDDDDDSKFPWVR